MDSFCQYLSSVFHVLNVKPQCEQTDRLHVSQGSEGKNKKVGGVIYLSLGGWRMVTVTLAAVIHSGLRTVPGPEEAP